MNFDDIKDNVGYITMDVTALDMLLQFEKLLEESGIYAYKNWECGEVVEGPGIQRHWVEVVLMYPHKLMPEPQGGMRLIKLGAKVSYSKDIFEEPQRVIQPQDVRDSKTRLAKMKKNTVWLVTIKMPRRLIDDEIDEYLALDDVDFDVDTDDISQAYDEDQDGIQGTQEEDAELTQDIASEFDGGEEQNEL